MDRRTFSKLSLATAATAGIPLVGAGLAQPLLVFFDPRYSDSRRFADSFTAMGGERINTASDIAYLWYSRLQARAEHGTLPMAGLTTHSDLLVLERCAADAKLRLRFEAFHDCRGASTITHVVTQRCGHSTAATLAAADTDWAAALARSIMHDVGPHRLSPLRLTTTAARATDHPGTLVSWLIA